MKKLYTLLIVVLSFECNAQIVNIPDANFKDKLLNYTPAIDTNADGEIQTSEALQVSELYLNDSDISNLTGIEAFANLNFLYCDNNHLTDLPIDNLTNLITLSCNENNLTSLNVTNLTQLAGLACYYNSITSLDTASLLNLMMLECSSNQLTELDLSNATKLSRVSANSNLFTALDFSHFIPTPGNSVTSYNLSNNPNLVSVNIKNGAPLETMQPGFLLYPFYVHNCNNLQYVCADDINLERLSVYTEFNPNIQLNTYCTLTTDTFEDQTISIIPNPVKDKLHITAKQNITSIELFDVQGRLIETHIATGTNADFNVADNASGIYFIKIYTQQGVKVEKIIKE